MLIDPISCLAAAIYFEARGELRSHRRKVAETVINRVLSNRYPNSICEVVKQKHQFTFYWDGKLEIVTDKKAWKEAKLLALQVIVDYVEYNDICHYARKEIENKWTVTMEKEIHGNHAFYRGGC